MVDFGANDMMPHFIYCHTQFRYPNAFEKLKRKILIKMLKYGIRSSILTTLHMRRRILITNEKAIQAAEGKLKNEPIWEYYEGSINDDLDSFINNLRNSNEMCDETVWSFSTPKLTKQELKLVEEKDKEHMMSYLLKLNADVDVEEMKKSDSKDKYVHSYCRRETGHLSLESKRPPSKEEPPNNLPSPSPVWTYWTKKNNRKMRYELRK